MTSSGRSGAIVVAVVAIGLVGCQTYAPSGEVLSPIQKRAVTTKLVDGSYDDTYRAVMAVLQDQDYGIRETDMETGLIVAEVQRASSTTRRSTGTVLGDVIEIITGATVAEGSSFELSCIVGPITDSTTEVRLSIHVTTYGSANTNGVRRESSEQIYDPEVFREFFNQIDVEVRRRQAMRGVR